ncbi:MAG: hypothetical protein Kow00124_10600 [Anaerolineae bacterium]
MTLSADAQQVLDAWDSKDLGRLASVLAEDYILYGGAMPLSKQDVLALMGAYFTALPDFSFNFTDAWEDGNVIGVTTNITGTHTGTLDLTPVGIPVTLAPTDIAIHLPPQPSEAALEGGQMVHHQLAEVAGAGLPGILAQLGVELPGG